MNAPIDLDSFRPRPSAKDALISVRRTLTQMKDEERGLFMSSLGTLTEAENAQGRRRRETTLIALLDDTCEFMVDLAKPERVPGDPDRAALNIQVDAIRGYLRASAA